MLLFLLVIVDVHGSKVKFSLIFKGAVEILG